MPDAQVTFNQIIDGQVAANVLTFSNITDDAPDLLGFADQLRTDWEFYLQQYQTVNWSLENLTVGFIDQDHISHSVDVEFTDGQLAGSANQDMLPSQIALLCSTAFLGPKPNRGRIYFMGLTEISTEDNVWDGAPITAVADLVRGWMNGVNAPLGDKFLRIGGRPKHDRPNYVSNPVSLVTPRGAIKTQRRRAR